MQYIIHKSYSASVRYRWCECSFDKGRAGFVNGVSYWLNNTHQQCRVVKDRVYNSL